MKREIQLLAQADLLLVVADLLRPPEKIRHSLDELDIENLQLLIDATGLNQNASLVRQLQVAVELARSADPDQWSGCYRLLFDGALICPINEAGFVRRDKGAIIGDVCGFYRAFGWSAADNSGERPDHLLVELEFVAMLLVMAARAESREESQLTENALAEFTRQHLSDWILVFCQQLKNSTSYELLVETANLLEIVWPALVDWHDWIVDPAADSPVGLADEPENPYECGAPDLVTLEAPSTP